MSIYLLQESPTVYRMDISGLLTKQEFDLCQDSVTAEIKRAVVGYGRAEKHQVQQMVKLLLGLDAPPAPHDVADALAVALCHLHAATNGVAVPAPIAHDRRTPRSWRHYRPSS